MSAAKTLAAVMTSPRRIELRELPIPGIAADAGLLRVAACGVCAGDWPKFLSESAAPTILGHEIVGTIEAIGGEARVRWGVREGDEVAVEEYIPCGHCSYCRAGDYRSCPETDPIRLGSLRYGATPLSVSPALYGGHSQYLYLHPKSVIHRIPRGIPPRIAALAAPLAKGFQWAHIEGGAEPGKAVIIFGMDLPGLCCVAAAAASGADSVAAIGLGRDRARFPIASRLGATHTLAADDGDIRARIAEITRGAMADIVIDTSSAGAEIVNAGIFLLKKGGNMICASPKKTPVPFDIGRVTGNRIRLTGASGHSFAAMELALQLMQSKRVPLELLATRAVGLADSDRALRIAGGEAPDDAIHIAVEPWKNGHAHS